MTDIESSFDVRDAGDRPSASEQVQCPGCGNYVTPENGHLRDHFVNAAGNGVMDGRLQPPADGGWHLCPHSNRPVPESGFEPSVTNHPDGTRTVHRLTTWDSRGRIECRCGFKDENRVRYGMSSRDAIEAHLNDVAGARRLAQGGGRV